MNKIDKKKAQEFFNMVIESAKETTKLHLQAIKLLEQGKCHFRIHLISLWANEGEKSLTYNAEPGHSLKKAVRDADLAFMAQNNRSDVQADKHASLIMENGTYACMEHPHEKEKKRERKRIQLERRKQKVDKKSANVS